MSSWNKRYLTPYDKPVVGDTKISSIAENHMGWLVCDGSLVSKVDYPALFVAIGTAYGGTGVTSFALPNAAGRVPGVVSNTRVLGSMVGAETHTLTVAEMPSHGHTGTTDASGNHFHNYQDAFFLENKGQGQNRQGFSGGDSDNDLVWRDLNGNGSGVPVDLPTSTNGSHQHTFTTQRTGGDQAHNNMQPTIFVGNLFIYAGRKDLPDPSRRRKGIWRVHA